MKTKILIILLVVASLSVLNCGGPKVKLNLSKQGNIGFSNAGGNTNPERGLNILAKQSRVNTLILLEKKLQEAILIENYRKAEKIQELINTQKTKTVPLALVSLYNDTKYEIDVIGSNEFTETTLKPFSGSLTQKEVPLGVLSISIIWRNPQTGATGMKIKEFVVTTHTNVLYISKGRSRRYKR